MLKNKISKSDYLEIKGDSWPSWDDYLAGKRTDSEKINSELDLFTKNFGKIGKVFPIQSATSCLYKWSGSSIMLPMNSSASCCFAEQIPLDPDNFDNFHNHPKKIEDRERMIRGEWPTSGCQVCIDIEEQGGMSERQASAHARNLIPYEMNENPMATHVTPSSVQLFTHNTCNFSCVYCCSYLSSQIEYENHRFGRFEKDGVILEDTLPTKLDVSEMFTKTISWLDKNIDKLKRLDILGGESFLQHELLEAVFEILDRKPNSDLQISMFSNINAPDKYWNKYINKIRQLSLDKKIKGLVLNVSVDCWGPESEYVRYGLDLDMLDKRMVDLSKQGDWLTMEITSVVSSMSIHTIDQLIAKSAEWIENKPDIGMRWMFTFSNDAFYSEDLKHYLHPEVFKYETWGDSFERCYRELDKIDKNILFDKNKNKETGMPTTYFTVPYFKERLRGLESHLKAIKHNDMKKVKQLHIYLDEIDRRRGTNWRKLFPYLDVNE